MPRVEDDGPAGSDIGQVLLDGAPHAPFDPITQKSFTDSPRDRESEACRGSGEAFWVWAKSWAKAKGREKPAGHADSVLIDSTEFRRAEDAPIFGKRQ